MFLIAAELNKFSNAVSSSVAKKMEAAAAIIGLTAAIQQLLTTVYQFGQGVREAKAEINQLCSELLALKAALDHVQLNLNAGLTGSFGAAEDAQLILSSSNFSTSEFKDMISSTDKCLKGLLARLDRKPSKFKIPLNRVTWPLIKSEVKQDIARLDQLKSFFILATTSDNTVLCRELYLKVCTMDRRLKDQESVQERKHTSELRQALKKWLAPCDPHYLFEKSLGDFHEGTGEWFLDGIFSDWMDQRTEPVLWLRAKPGSGKTTLLSAAIKRAQDSLKCLAYFFCSFTDQDSQDLRNILGSLLIQLCEADPKLWKDVEDQYLKRKGPSPHEPKRMKVREVEQLLTQSTRQLSETLVILDAANESKQSSKILQSLVNLLQEGGSVRIMLSSTEGLDHIFPSRKATLATIEQAKTSQDVGKYIEGCFEDDHKLCDLPAALKDDIKVTLQTRHDGV